MQSCDLLIWWENGTYECLYFNSTQLKILQLRRREFWLWASVKVLDKNVVLFQNGAFVIIATKCLQVRYLAGGRGDWLIYFSFREISSKNKYGNKTENTPRNTNLHEIPASIWWNENFPHCLNSMHSLQKEISINIASMRWTLEKCKKEENVPREDQQNWIVKDGRKIIREILRLWEQFGNLCKFWYFYVVCVNAKVELLICFSHFKQLVTNMPNKYLLSWCEVSYGMKFCFLFNCLEQSKYFLVSIIVNLMVT